LYAWNEAAEYEAVQIFDRPVALKAPLQTMNPEGELPTGTEIEVTVEKVVLGGLRSPECYRIIRVERQERRTKESDLLAALGDPIRG
jgi:hypothetical protein